MHTHKQTNAHVTRMVGRSVWFGGPFHALAEDMTAGQPGVCVFVPHKKPCSLPLCVSATMKKNSSMWGGNRLTNLATTATSLDGVNFSEGDLLLQVQ